LRFFPRPESPAEVCGLELEVSDDGLVLGLPAAAVICAGQVAVGADERVNPCMSVAPLGHGTFPNTSPQRIGLET